VGRTGRQGVAPCQRYFFVDAEQAMSTRRRRPRRCLSFVAASAVTQCGCRYEHVGSVRAFLSDSFVRLGEASEQECAGEARRVLRDAVPRSLSAGVHRVGIR
jgi:hypothetical protein